jgi:integrase
MVHRSNQRGTLRFDRRFGPVGRLNIASGTEDRDQFRRMNDMLTELYRTGRWDFLRALRNHQLAPLELWDAWRTGRMHEIPTTEELVSLSEAVDRWLKGFDASPKHRDRYEGIFDELIEPKTTVAQLPKLLRAFREQCQEDGRHRTFNLARAACQAFLRDTFGKQHRLWVAVSTVPTLRVTSRKGRKLTVKEAADIAQRLGVWGAEWWALCLTGMRRSEYFGGRWTLAEDRIVVHGTKRQASNRFVPKLFEIIKPRLTHWGFGQALHRVTGGAIRPHDARHTFMHWMELAQVPRIRRKLYLGHSTSHDVSELYEEHDVAGFLVEDANRLHGFIGEEPAKVLRVVGDESASLPGIS